MVEIKFNFFNQGIIMVCYLILGSYNQKNIVNLIKSLDCANVKFIVHIDKKVSINNDLISLNSLMTNLHFVENRIICNWSGFSLVRAMLSLLDYASLISSNDSVFQLLSDSCIVLQDPFYTRDQLTKIGTNVHLWGKLSNNKVSHIKPKSFQNYWLYDISFLNYKNYSHFYLRHLVKYSETTIRILLSVFKKPLSPRIYKGSQWFSITKSHWLLTQKSIDDSFLNKFRYARAPDEMFFQTAFMLSGLEFNLENAQLNHYANHWIDWSEVSRGPKLLNNEDIKRLQLLDNSLFARKITSSYYDSPL